MQQEKNKDDTLLGSTGLPSQQQIADKQQESLP
jgi:hypothetical protein